MQSELENTKRAADQAKAQATELAKRTTTLNSELEKANAERDELQTKLDQITSAIKSAQSRPELEKANAQRNMVEPENAGGQRDLLLSYSKVGDVLMAQGNLAEALKSYQDGLAVADRLAKSQAQATSGSDEESSAIDTSRQPLTRLDCDKAGMAWNDSANVCGSVAGEAAVKTAPSSEAPETARRR